MKNQPGARRVRWDQRAMAGLSVYYLVQFTVLARLVLPEDEDDGLGSFLVLAAVLATLLLIRNRTVFAVLAPMAGLLLLATFCAFPPFAPAALPLLLAQIPPSDRATRAGELIRLAVTAAGLTWVGWIFLHWT